LPGRAAITRDLGLLRVVRVQSEEGLAVWRRVNRIDLPPPAPPNWTTCQCAPPSTLRYVLFETCVVS
jgi:hypothetical protein